MEYNDGMKRKLPSSNRKSPTKREQEEEAKASYDKLLEKWARAPKFARTAPPKPETRLVLDLGAPAGRESVTRIPSRVTPGGSTSKKDVMQYTGSKMLGIGQMHKSNSVPIFSKDDAVDVAKMRRN